MALKSKLKKIIVSGVYKYFYYIFLISVAIILVLGLSLYLYFSSVLRNEAIRENNNTLNQLKNVQEAVLSETDKSISNIVLDPIIINYMDYYEAHDDIMMNEAQNKLDNVINLDDSIDSVYVYYLDNSVVLSSGQGAINVADFNDSAFLSSIDWKKMNTRHVEFRASKDRFNGQSTTLLTFVNPIPIYVATGGPKAIVVFNVKSNYIYTSINSIMLNDLSDILISDGNGIVISSKNDIPTNTNRQIVKDVGAHGRKDSGYYISHYNGENMLVSYVSFNKYNWKYVYITPMSAITASIRFQGFITIILCILMILLSIFGSLLLSRRLYSPIKSALAMFDRSATKNVAAVQVNETDLLCNNINNIILKNQSLEKLLQEYDASQKDSFLLSLLIGTAQMDNKLEEKLQYYGVTIDPNDYFIACVISMDNYSKTMEKYSEKQINMTSIYIREQIHELLLSTHNGFIVEKEKNEVIVVMNFPAVTAPYEMKKARYFISKDIHETISKDIKYTFTIGVSASHQGIDSLRACYTECAMAINYRLLLGYNHVTFYESIAAHDKGMVPYPFSHEKKILNSIKTGDQNGILKLLDEFTVCILCIPNENIEFARYYFLQLLTASIKCFYEINQNFGIKVTQMGIYTDILKQGTIQEIVVLMKELYREFSVFMDVQRNARKKEMVASISGYIEKNLNADLSLECVADKFFISVSQLRKVFKDEIGVAPKDFIDGIRMKAAMQLLQNTSMNVNKVAEQVGYVTVQSFTRAFKAEIGNTPGEYRIKSRI